MTIARKTKTRKSESTDRKTSGSRTRLDTQVRRNMIVEAAFKAIAKEGFEGLRTREIAKVVGINSATLHHHFPTKEYLISAVADHLQDRFRSEHIHAVENENTVSALERQLKDTIFYHKHRPELLAVYREFVGRASRDHMIQKLVRQLHEGWHADVVETLRNGVADGSLCADLDLASTSRVILSAVWGFIAHIFSSRRDFDAGFHELMKWLAVNPNDRSQMMRDPGKG